MQGCHGHTVSFIFFIFFHPRRLLGAHRRRRAEHFPRSGQTQVGIRRRTRHTEVEHVRPTRVVDQPLAFDPAGETLVLGLGSIDGGKPELLALDLTTRRQTAIGRGHDWIRAVACDGERVVVAEKRRVRASCFPRPRWIWRG